VLCLERTYASLLGCWDDQPLASLLTGMIPLDELLGAKMVVSVIFSGVRICCWRTSLNGFPARFSIM
jgi:hypothetical protein